MSNSGIRFVYFGGEPIGVPVLKALCAHNLTPALVVTNPDRPAGRGQKLTPPPVKVFAYEHNLPVWQPDSLKDEVDIRTRLTHYDLFVVVAYNRILPKWLIDLPPHGTLNLHPSLLPLRRGPNPIRSAIVEDDRASIGVSIMCMDEDMDHGPLLAQQTYPIADTQWPMAGPELDAALARHGGLLLADTIPAWVTGTITPQPQDHSKATYTKKLTRQDGALIIDPHQLPTGTAAHTALCTIRGLAGWPSAHFIYQGTRIKINDASIENDTLRLITVTPEGKKPLPFDQWLPNSNR